MEKKNIPSFYTINWNFNSDNIEYYDVMPYLINCWEEEKKHKHKIWNKDFIDKNNVVDDTKMSETFDEFKKFILSNSQYMFWSRCEYEVIVTGWPQHKNKVKIDVFQQIKQNIDVITKLFMDYIFNSK